jgi:anti-sigma B factor antagonist
MTGVSSHDAAPPGPMNIDSRRGGHGVVLVLTGELDLASAPELDRQLRALESTNPGRVLIDLSRLEFMDSTGIATLIGGQRAAISHGYQFLLRRGPTPVQRLFELAGVSDYFTFED